MKLTRKLLYASILFFIIIFILNKIIGIKLSNDINDELKRIFLNQNFIFDNTNDIYIYENQINDTQISYHGIKVNPTLELTCSRYLFIGIYSIPESVIS